MKFTERLAAQWSARRRARKRAAIAEQIAEFDELLARVGSKAALRVAHERLPFIAAIADKLDAATQPEGEQFQ